MLAYAPVSQALPGPGQIISGTASISATGPRSLVITQSSQNAILLWNSFNIGSGESVQFIQPNAEAVALNRVLGTDPSNVMGHLSANGKVFLVNPNGILFGTGASVDTAALVASTLDISNVDFLQSRYRFASDTSAEVRNQGSLQVTPGGYVALLGHAVRNEGTINAPAGTVALAAGGAVTLNLSGDGLLQAQVDRAALDAVTNNGGVLKADGGLVQLSASAQEALLRTVVNNSGMIQANSLAYRNGRVLLEGGGSGVVAVSGTVNAKGESAGTRGGSIVATGDKLLLTESAQLDASGSDGGGSIYIGGSWQGQNPTIAQATGVYVTAGAQLDASASHQGDGGTVVAWTDIYNPLSSTQVHGTLLARGGAQGGNGGRIETSGHWLDVAGVRADASAAHGQAGVWLLDPEDLTVGAIATDTGVALGPPTTTYMSGAGTPNVLNTDIEAQLNAGTNVVLQTAPSGGGAGNITVNASIAKTLGGDATLTFNAIGGITFNAATGINASSGKLHVNLGSGGTIAFAGGNTLNTNGGDIAMTAQQVTGIPTLTGSGIESFNLNILGPGSIGIGTGLGTTSLPSSFATGFTSVNVLAGTGDITVGGAVSFTDSVVLATQGNVVIDPGASISSSVTGGSLVLAGTNFLNSGGASAVSAPGGGSRWVIYSADPSTNTFGSLASGSQAIWGQDPGTLPPFAVPAGNRYIFGTTGVITATSSGTYSKTYGQTANLSGAVGYSGMPLSSAGTYGNVYLDLLVTDALSSLPTAASAGAVPSASVTGSPYGIAPTGGSANPGYNINYVGGGTLNVLPAPLAVNAQNISQPYNGQPFSGGSVSYGGFVNGENATALGGTLSFGGNSQGAINIGPYTIIPSGLTSSNYALTFNNGALNISAAALTISANTVNKVYDGLAFSGGAGVSYSGFVNGETASVLSGTLGYSGTSQGAVNAGQYTITPGGLSSSNYNISYLNGTLNIATAPLIISAGSATKVYDGLTFSGGAGVSYSGFVNGETASVLSGTLGYNGTSQGAVNAGQYTITPGGLGNGNYVIQYQAGVLTVQPKPLNITGLVASSKDFDGTDSVTILNWGGVTTGVGAETLVLQHGNAQFGDSTIGLNKTVTASGYQLADGNQNGLASNYVLQNSTAQTTASIFPPASQSTLQSVRAFLSQPLPTIYSDRRADMILDARLLGFSDSSLLRGTPASASNAAGSQPMTGVANANLVLRGQRIVSVQPQQTPVPTGQANASALAQIGSGTGSGATRVNSGNAATVSTAHLSSAGFSGGSKPGTSVAGPRPGPASAPALPKDAFLKGVERASIIGATSKGTAIIASFSGAGQITRLQSTVAPGEGFRLDIPGDLLGKASTRGPAPDVQATANGAPLPPWLRLDRQTLQLRASTVPPAALPLTVRLVGKSGSTVEVVLK